MAQEFEDQDLSQSVFWATNLQRSTFRDSDLSGATFFHSNLSGASIDGEISGLTINGVDVTDFVRAHDRWYPLREELSPPDLQGVKQTWAKLTNEWSKLFEAVSVADPAVVDKSVNDEWSLNDTLRHLLFAIDKWFSWPILGERTFSPIGLPNTGSQGFEWPGLDLKLKPKFGEVRQAREAQLQKFARYLNDSDISSLPPQVEVLENGLVPTLQCFHVVLEEEFEHLRYILRDLASLGVRPTSK